MYVYLHACMSPCLFDYLYICLYACVFACRPVCLSVRLCSTLGASVCEPDLHIANESQVFHRHVRPSVHSSRRSGSPRGPLYCDVTAILHYIRTSELAESNEDRSFSRRPSEGGASRHPIADHCVALLPLSTNMVSQSIRNHCCAMHHVVLTVSSNSCYVDAETDDLTLVFIGGHPAQYWPLYNIVYK